MTINIIQSGSALAFPSYLATIRKGIQTNAEGKITWVQYYNSENTDEKSMGSVRKGYFMGLYGPERFKLSSDTMCKAPKPSILLWTFPIYRFKHKFK